MTRPKNIDSPISPNIKHVLLADDDIDDCNFFKEALEGYQERTMFTIVNDGEQLIDLLITIEHLPDVIFLDINMPRKNGVECLTEIKRHKRLEAIPVIIFTTTFERGVVDLMYQKGAHYFICKPGEFLQFKKIIQQSLILLANGEIAQPHKEHFVLKVANTRAA
ncbi:MAG: response regulator receiver protein [Segetibacter sp.]|nr:response regulator receiver protein [Segetibacter sp.]